MRMILLLILLGAVPMGSLISVPDNTTPPMATILRLDGSTLTAEQIDGTVERLMTKGRVPGLGIALIQDGRPVHVKAYGRRNVEKNLPLQADTVMYAASWTKLTFAYLVMQLVDEGIVDLDRSIAKYLKKPLPDYPKYADLGGDERWRALTPRILLNHTPGFPNFRFINPNGKLDFKFDPGARYAYSGEGINLLQSVLEEGLGLDIGKEMQRRVFDRFGMARTSMTWRDDFAANCTQGYDVEGRAKDHHQRRSVRAAGSMDTTLTDYAKFVSGFLRGEGLSANARAEMLRPQIAITSAHQFPTLAPAVNSANREIGLSSGLGAILFRSPYGDAFFKGGHDDHTGNQAVGIVPKKSGILLMSNSVRGETIYPALTGALFGDTRLPWSWEYNPQGSPPPIADK